jgi:hypothetical protein
MYTDVYILLRYQYEYDIFFERRDKSYIYLNSV